MDMYLIIKTLHIISATILFGTGAGIAFFMFRAHFTNNLHEKHFAARNTVLADYIFTAPAVIIQPLTGFWLIWQGGYDWNSLWLSLTYGIYVLAGLCWLPVIAIQIRLKHMVAQALNDNAPLPDKYNKLFKLWFVLGWPAFIGLVIVFFLMVFKPA
ncbi:MAG: DUF2269 domain-containing protein [Alphaproteobacteria bacterium]|nr:DUF2269 domain-containing protein [Alphaproteobacteria bacterium]